MSADLQRARVERGDVLGVQSLGGGTVELVARLPHLAANAAPGEFAQLRCDAGISPLLRRPMSVAWTDGDTCSFVFEAVGTGTRLLADLRPGDILDALGPLGNGFSLDPELRDGTVICVAGGLGCAPFPLLIRALRSIGVADILVINGAATAARLYPAERFQRGQPGVRVLEATDDGSRGHAGRVTELLAAHAPAKVSAVYACGPNPMLAALIEAITGSRIAPRILEASLEAPMGCGFGTCLGCALPVHTPGGQTGWRLCCTDGPVMPMGVVDWTALRALPAAGVA